jgi:hypothetical protein
VLRLGGVVLARGLAASAGLATSARAATPPAPWVAVSDIHLAPNDRDPNPSPYGSDTDPVLFRSLLAELHLRDPDPPVVIIAGDFLAHEFNRRNAAGTMAHIAARFNALYPHAQFLITLGNNDSPCGDYAAPIGGPFLAATAKAWAPLVDRRGAAPNFAKTFAHDGSYVATLPIPGLRAVAINDVSFSLRTNDSCAAGINPRSNSLGDLTRSLHQAPPGSHTWLLLHIPPGIDAYSTSYLAHRLAVIPFMRPNVRAALDAAIADPYNDISLVVAGHTHKFAYRISSGAHPVPMLLVPSVSPIFSNAPSFLELGVGPRGTIGTVREISYRSGAWQPLGDLAALGVRAFDAPQLLALQARLAQSRSDREQFARLYSGGAPPEITESNWRTYWCSATAFSASAFQRCDDQHGLSILLPRALELAALAVAIVLLAGGILFVAFRFEKGRPA